MDLKVKNMRTQATRHGLTARLAREASLITIFVALTYSDSPRPLIFRDLRALCCQVLLGLGVFAVLLGSSGGLMYSAGISPVSVFRKVTMDAISPSASCLPS